MTMNLEMLREYCKSKKGVREDFPFDDKTLVFKVGPKMFGLTNIKDSILKVNLKCDPIISLSLRNDYPSINPGYHMNKDHWNTVTIDDTLEENIIKWLIDMSYDLVIKSLTKKEREKIESLSPISPNL